MAAWWQSLSALDHVLLYIAVPATLILLIQTVLLFAGGAFDSDGDASAGDSPVIPEGARGWVVSYQTRSTRPRRTRRPPTPACTCSLCGAWWPSWCSSAGAACGSTR